MTKLMSIQPMVQDVTEAISAALGIEVEIVDNALTVVGGSECIKKRVGQKEELGQLDSDFLYARILRTGKAFVVKDARSDPRYDPSSLKGTTAELAEICSPIKLAGDIIGVIGLIAFTPGQKKRLMSNTQGSLLFLKHMGRLLAAKVSENEAMERLTALSGELSTVLETIHEGALAINDRGLVTHCNSIPEKLLQIKRMEILGYPLAKFWENAPALDVLRTGQEYIEKEEIYHTGTRKMHFIVSVRPITGSSGTQGAVISFRDIAEARRLIYDLSETHVRYTFDDIIGDSMAIKLVKEKALRVAGGNSTVLITGESGTGKEVFARAIHQASSRSGGPFISINCGAIPETLLESELFGYEGGAFTGARKEGKAGKFELANKGTIFLDEIGEMPLHLQVKLLHILQDREVERVGGAKKIPVDVRIIAASNRDMETMMHEGKFRKDLYFRLSVIPLSIPPLKERREDIPALVIHCLDKYGRMLNNRSYGIEPAAMERLVRYSWPGNVRELENAVEYAVNMAGSSSIITVNNLPPQLGPSLAAGLLSETEVSLKSILKEHERKVFAEYLERFGNSQEGKINIARKLSISRATLYRKLAELELS